MNHWPEEFLHRSKLLFKDEYTSFLDSLSTPAPVSVRLNPFKRNIGFVETQVIPWSKNGRYLPERPSFTLDPLFHAGTYYVQEASSQFLEQLFLLALKDNPEPIVLDLCAAPGGKSTHLLSLLNGEGCLVSNEVIPSRNKILQQNIAKWGCTNSFVTQNDPADFKRLPGVFDIIVVDAPCSGEGLFRRDPEAADEWSEKAVEHCSARQNQILESIHESLKPGGYLIYSTCTFENSENGDQIERMISEFGYEVCNSVPAENGIVQSEYGYHFYPHKVVGEGLFISMIRKPIDHDKRFRMRHEDPQNYGKDFRMSFSSYFRIDANLSAFVKDDHVYAIPTEHYSLFALLFKNLFVRQAGIFTGTQKDKNFIPSTELALSLSASDQFPSANVDLPTALTYLRGESISLANAPQGWTIIQYENQNLGWVKVLDRRVNNYYPKEWKVMKR